MTRRFRAYTVTSDVATNGVIIPFPCILDAIIRTREGGIAGSFFLFDSATGPSGRQVLSGVPPLPLSLSGLNLRLDNGLWLQTSGALPTAYWTFIAAPL